MSNGFLSKRVKRRDPSGITSDRYQYLGLDQAEPDLGDPIVGPSSIGINPYTGDVSQLYVLVSDGSGEGNRYWTQQTNIISGGVVSPGSITIRDEGSIIGGANQITDINFIGSGVTIVSPASWSGAGSSSVDVSITVTDVSVPSGSTGSIGYRDSSGLLQGASVFVYDSSNQRVGIGSTIPTEKLDLIGNIKAQGNISAQNISASSFNVNNFIVNEQTLTFRVTSEAVGIGTTLPTATLDVRGSTNIAGVATISVVSTPQLNATNINASGITTSDSYRIGTNEIISSSRQLRNIASLDAVTTATIESAIAAAPNTFNDLNVTGIATIGTGSTSIVINQGNISVSGLTTTKDLYVSGISTSETANIIGLTTTKDLYVSGISTIKDLYVSGLTTTTDLYVSGISTSKTANIIGLTTTKDLYVSGISTSETANIIGLTTTKDLYVSGVSTSGTVNIIGLTTTKDLYVSGIATANKLSLVSDTGNSNIESQNEIGIIAPAVGIGTTNPQTKLDVIGDVRFTGAIYVSNGSGTTGQVLISDGTNPVTWGSPSEVTVGSATSVTVTNTNTNDFYYLGFTKGTTGNQGINLDSNGLVYNPSTNNLGIGSTQPKVSLDVVGNANITGIITAGSANITGIITADNVSVRGITKIDSGLTTTYNKNTVVIDNLDTSQFRSARYNVQVTTFGRLIPGSGSITLLEGGSNYSAGTYENVTLVSSNGSGVGTDAKATIVIEPKATLGITSSYEGLFFTNGNITGIETGQIIYFDKRVFVSTRDESRISDLITSSGVGYTVFPSVSIDSPIIEGNPVAGVGVGSTASLKIDSLKVTNVVLNSGSGLVESTIPTVSFAPPVGSGTTATGLVGFGVSTIGITSSGFGYRTIPSIVLNRNATAEVSGMFVTNLQVNNVGVGYTPVDFPVAITVGSPTVGLNTATITQTSFCIANDFQITSAGTGYTSPPILTVSSPSIGINTATVNCTLGISTFTVGAAGSGYVSSPNLNLSQNPTNFSARVGLGISDYLIQVSGGSNYSDFPTIQINPVGGIGTGAALGFTTINSGAGNRLEGLVITNPGYGYTVPPLVSISGGGGTGAAVTIRTMSVSDVLVFEDGYGLASVPSATISESTTLFADLVVAKQGTVGIATTTILSSIVFSSQGTLSTASTTIISGISTFNTIQYTKTGDLDQPTDFSITGINTSDIRVGQGVTGTNVSAGTTVIGVQQTQVLLSQGTTNSVPVISNTFYFNDTKIQSVQVGQGVTGTSISAGSTVVSIGTSAVTLSLAAFNSGSSTNTYYFGPIQTVPGIGPTTIITGITTSSILVGQGVTGNNVPTSTTVSNIGSETVTISNSTTNTGITTQTFYFNTLTNVVGSGALVTPSLGIGGVTVTGFGTGYLSLPGIAVTANNGITGGGGIVTTKSFGIDTNCVSVANSGAGYTNTIPSVSFNPPSGGGTATSAVIGVGISAISVTSSGSGYTSTKPTVVISGDSNGVGLAATVNNIVITNVVISNAGYGYTASDLPLVPTFSNVGIAGSTGFGIYSATILSTGIGYTLVPSVSITPSASLGSTTNATITAVLGYPPSSDLLPGPTYGGTKVYYIQPQSSNTFRISANPNGTGPITLGYSTSNSPSAAIGGEVTSVTITEPGSGYLVGKTVELLNSNFDVSNVGAGFSFVVGNTYSDFQISDILMLQTVGSASTDVHIIEYAGISNLESLGEYSADISGSNARLKFDPIHSINEVKISKTSITN